MQGRRLSPLGDLCRGFGSRNLGRSPETVGCPSRASQVMSFSPLTSNKPLTNTCSRAWPRSRDARREGAATCTGTWGCNVVSIHVVSILYRCPSINTARVCCVGPLPRHVRLGPYHNVFRVERFPADKHKADFLVTGDCHHCCIDCQTCSHGSGHAGLILDTSQHAEHEKTTHVMRRLHACDLA